MTDPTKEPRATVHRIITRLIALAAAEFPDAERRAYEDRVTNEILVAFPSRPEFDPDSHELTQIAVLCQEAIQQHTNWSDSSHLMTAYSHATVLSQDIPTVIADNTEMRESLRDCWGALNFILAFYEPGQRYLDTEAWKVAEASGRSAHKKAGQILDKLRPDSAPAVPVPAYQGPMSASELNTLLIRRAREMSELPGDLGQLNSPYAKILLASMAVRLQELTGDSADE